jgi:PAS domain S-box-containing protein
VVNAWDFTGAVLAAQHLLPETRRVVVIVGNTPWEAGIEALARHELEPLTRGMLVSFWSGVEVSELERRIGQLSAGTVVLYVSVFRDRSGASYQPRSVLRRLSARSSVPIFGLSKTFLGFGIVGGRLIDFSALGTQTGALAARILGGEQAASLAIQSIDPGAPRFDAQALTRWKIHRSQLPPGAVVEFETPSIWQQYRWQLVGLLLLILLETLLVGALLIQGRRRRQAEESERRASVIGTAVIGSLQEAVAVLDRVGIIVTVNTSWIAYAKARGRVADLAVGANVLVQARAAVAEGVRGAARGLAGLEGVLSGALASFESSYEVLIDGVERSFELKAVPLARAEGGAVMVLEDVTLRREAEERFRLVVEAQPTAMIMVDAAGTMALVNRQTEHLFGYERNELLGKRIEMLIPERFRTQHPGLRAGFLARPATRSMAGRELFGLRRDGSEFPLEIGLSPIKSGADTLVLSTLIDVTEKRRADGELQRLRGEMAHFARVATVGELSAAIAHELNQPLTGILSNAQAGQRFLDAGVVDPQELQEILADVVADGRRAGEVIRRLRALLHKGPQDLVSIEINELVDQVARLVAGDLALRSAALDLELAADLPRIRGDRVQLQQVLLNLIINGIDAMKDSPTENRRLLVRTSPADGREVRVEVRDDGAGIPEEVMPRLFEPFFSTKREGMGMGLSIVRSIVSNHGGRIWASNNVSRGATFTLALPAVRGDSTQ